MGNRNLDAAIWCIAQNDFCNPRKTWCTTLRSINLALEQMWVGLNYTEPLNSDCMQLTPKKWIFGCKHTVTRQWKRGMWRREQAKLELVLSVDQEVGRECDQTLRTIYSPSGWNFEHFVWAVFMTEDYKHRVWWIQRKDETFHCDELLGVLWWSMNITGVRILLLQGPCVT